MVMINPNKSTRPEHAPRACNTRATSNWPTLPAKAAAMLASTYSVMPMSSSGRRP